MRIVANALTEAAKLAVEAASGETAPRLMWYKEEIFAGRVKGGPPAHCVAARRRKMADCA